MSACACGRDVWVKRAGVCRYCYNLRYYSPTHLPVKAPRGSTPLTSTPCSYAAAHERLKGTRGRAAQHLCPCGRQAEQWSYNHSSDLELEGENRQGRMVRYSPYVWDYNALCTSCHVRRDQRKSST